MPSRSVTVLSSWISLSPVVEPSDCPIREGSTTVSAAGAGSAAGGSGSGGSESLPKRLRSQLTTPAASCGWGWSRWSPRTASRREGGICGALWRHAEIGY